MVLRDCDMTKFSNPPVIIIPIQTDKEQDFLDNGKKNTRIPYKYYYLAVVIIYLVWGAVELYHLGRLVYNGSSPNDNEIWIWSLFTFCLLVYVFFLLCGCNGYLRYDVKSAETFTIYVIIIAVYHSFRIIKDVDLEEKAGIFCLRIGGSLILIAMAYVSNKFVQALKKRLRNLIVSIWINNNISDSLLIFFERNTKKHDLD